MDYLGVIFSFTIFLQLASSKIVVEANNEARLIPSTPISSTTNLDYPDYEICDDTTQFTCDICIDLTQVCDGFEDCNEGEDEKDCSSDGDYDYDYGCGSYFDCGAEGECVDFSFICDGIEDCSSGKDEKNCSRGIITTTTLRPCTADEFTCSDNTCISIDRKCDGVSDCSDDADEKECTTVSSTTAVAVETSTLECPTECDYDEVVCGCTCVFIDFLCSDYTEICPDIVADNCDYDYGDPKTDAITTKSSFSSTVRSSITASPIQSTTRPLSLCGNNDFQCSDGTCISEDKRCDGQNDCPDGLDERTCPATSTSPIMTAISSAKTTTKALVQCFHENQYYDAGTVIQPGNCSGINCSETGKVIIWMNLDCSGGSTARINLLVLVLMMLISAMTNWR